MAYQVLARKWRPKTFTELAGQAHVVRALSNALTQNRLHHAYLLTGTRGVGKTTVARILAKALNCETGITATPCGVCSACTQIDAGRFVDLLELDAASNTGIDNMREVLDNAQYAPTVGRYKVYIIDEVHMLSKAAFNSMLKTLEEPPEHVKFILATTDPQKIPITVLSRCLQFNLKQMPPELVREHLTKVLTAENVEFQPAALPLIARAAQGSMRDALSLLDQAIAYGSGVVLAETVQNMLGTIDQRYLFDILYALINQNGTELLNLADNMATRSIDFDAALQDLAALLQQIALIQVVPNALSEDTPDKDTLTDLASRIPAQMVQLYYQISLHGRRDLALAPDEFAGFSMTLLRMLAFYPQTTTAPIAAPRPAIKPVVVAAAPTTVATAAPAATQAAPVTMAVPEINSMSTSSTAAFDGNWSSLVSQLKLGALARMLAVQCELTSFDDDSMQLCVSAEHKHLLDKPYHDKLREALVAHFNRPVRLNISVAAAAIANSPIQQQNEARAERQSQADTSVNTHPFTQDAINLLDARVANTQAIDQSTKE
ncbi:MAG: DNA polymerase III subunit gamma/tau [Sulfuriferula sp.]